MFNLFFHIRQIYSKTKINDFSEINMSFCLIVSRWLSYDKDNLFFLKQIFPYIFYIAPLHFYYLLWLNIPFKSKTPFLKKPIEQLEEKENELFKRIQKVFGWSSNELFLHKKLLEQVISPKEQYWKEKLGVNE